MEAQGNPLPLSKDLHRSDIGDVSERDYSNKYYVKTRETQFTGQMEEIGVPLESEYTDNGDIWREYRSTEVQMY